jgi:hypothetical protein
MAKKESLQISDADVLKNGCIAWMAAKDAEKKAIDDRREIEDYLSKYVLSIPETFEGSQSLTLDDIKLKVTGRMNRKVDGKRLEELATEHGLTPALDELFNWKPEVKLTEWKNADAAITSVLAEAIETTPGRVSFNISLKEEK